MHSARSPTSIPTDYSLLAFQRELHQKCDNHRRLCGWITVRRHFTVASLEMPQSPMTLRTASVRRHFIESGGNATITDDFANGLQPVDIFRQSTFTDKFTDGWCEFQRAGIKCISNSVPLPTDLPTDCEKYGG